MSTALRPRSPDEVTSACAPAASAASIRSMVTRAGAYLSGAISFLGYRSMSVVSAPFSHAAGTGLFGCKLSAQSRTVVAQWRCVKRIMSDEM